MPATEIGRRLPPADEAELRKKLPGLYEPRLRDLSAFLYHGLSRQLTSMPVDIRTERDLAQAWPEHLPQQRRYLARQVKDLEPAVAPELVTVSPARLFAASAAMNIVLAEEAGEIVGVPVGRVFREHEHRALGERLREQLHGIAEPGYPGDRKLTDRWADELWMQGWYRWVAWPDLP
ncbi:MAG: hypothetical protein AB1486_12950 [Planctomycetota bacterium]